MGRALTRGNGARRGFWWHGWDHDVEQRIGHGGEACYLVRRATIAEIGAQDERFWLDWEGIDWSRRVADADWEIWYCPQAEVVHVGGVSLRQVKYRWIFFSHRGMYRYFAPRAPRAVRPLLAAAIGLRAATKMAIATVDARIYDRAH
jgi:GT2 family glycosyltransferase